MSRAEKEELLKKFIAARSHILVTGQSGVGKTTLVLSVLSKRGSFNGAQAYIDCHEIATPTKLYQSIISQFTTNGRETRVTLASQIQQVDSALLVSKIELAYRRHNCLYLILDQVEQFKWTNLMDAFVVLATIPEINLLMISNEPAYDLLNYIKHPSIRLMIQTKLSVLELNPWTTVELSALISSEKPKADWQDTYSKFVNNMVVSQYELTKNLRELKFICQTNYGKFKEKLREELVRLYGKQKHYKTDELTEEYLMDFDLTAQNIMQAFRMFLQDFKLIKQEEWDNNRSSKVDTSISQSMTFMIVSAYIAAYTTPTEDKRNFVKYQHRKLSRGRDGKDHEREPKTFTLERLLQINRCLIHLQGHEKTGNSDLDDSSCQEQQRDENCQAREKLPEIFDSTLWDVELTERLGLIKVSSGDGVGPLTKYKISDQLTRQYVQRICKQIQLSLDDLHGL